MFRLEYPADASRPQPFYSILEELCFRNTYFKLDKFIIAMSKLKTKYSNRNEEEIYSDSRCLLNSKSLTFHWVAFFSAVCVNKPPVCLISFQRKSCAHLK